MTESDETSLLKILQESLLPGQGGIKIRAFLAFNRGNALVSLENLEQLKAKGLIDIHDDTVFPLDLL